MRLGLYRRIFFAVITVVCLLSGLAFPAHADTSIDTLSAWNGTEGTQWLVQGAIWGQTFVANQSTFYLTRSQASFTAPPTIPGEFPDYRGTPLTVQFEMYQWGGDRPTGPALFVGKPITIGNDDVFHAVDIPVPNLPLTPGQTYVACWRNVSAADSRARMGGRYTNNLAYPYGQLWWGNSQGTAWVSAGRDIAFRLDFTGSESTALVTNTSDSGIGSLRDAITYANAYTKTRICFQFPIPDQADPDWTGAFAIQPQSSLPPITAAGTILDGTTQTAFADTNPNGPEVELRGINAGENTTGLVILASECQVKGLVINGFDGDGIQIQGSKATDNHVTGCYIGTDPTGTRTEGMVSRGNGLNGVRITDAANNLITDNCISGNGTNLLDSGVRIEGVGAYGNRVQGNWIGLNVAGTGKLPNRDDGILVCWGAHDNRIGGLGEGERNVVSGNTGDGITLLGADTANNRVEGNYVGLTPSGTGTLGNDWAGVEGRLGASCNVIVGNVIAGNSRNGIMLEGVSGWTIQGNRIGLNADGTVGLGNSQSGIYLNQCSGITIGGTQAEQRNVIAGSNEHGICITGNSTNVSVKGNYIGTNATNTGLIPNAVNGVLVYGGSCTLGGPALGEGNIIRGNGNGSGSGVSVYGSSIRIEDNCISENVSSGLVVGNSTVTVQDNTFVGNRSNDAGGGAVIYTSNAHVIGNTFTGNYAGRSGCGMHFWQCSTAIVENNTLMENSGPGPCISANGTGTYAFRANVLQSSFLNGGSGIGVGGVTKTIIIGNSVTGSGWTGIDVRGVADATLANNMAFENGGDGINIIDTTSFSMTDNTFTENHGAGAYIVNVQKAVVTGNTFQGNYAIGLQLNGPQTAPAEVTITGNRVCGNGIKKDGWSGGIMVGEVTGVLSDNLIDGNRGTGNAGGLHVGGSNLRIERNQVTNNTASGAGGIMLAQSPSLELVGNRVTGNTATSWAGGGISVWEVEKAVLRQNTITGNRAPEAGAVYVSDAPELTLADNLIAGNASDRLAALHLQVAGGTVVNNTIADNTGAAPGIQVLWSSSLTLANNIVAFNPAGITADAALTLRNNDVFGNDGFNYAGSAAAGSGDVSLDPRFVDANGGGYRLRASSRCIDAGDDSLVETGATDLDDQARIANAHVDLGCYEFQGTADWESPVTTATTDPVASAAGWNKTPVTVNLSATDNYSGVASTSYRVDGGEEQTYTAPFTISAEGAHTVSYWSTDNAGNIETARDVPVRVDLTDPTITATATPNLLSPPNGAMLPVVVSGKVADTPSGAAGVKVSVEDEYGVCQPAADGILTADGSYSATLSLEAAHQAGDRDGRYYTINVIATDAAGNTGATTTEVIVPGYGSGITISQVKVVDVGSGGFIVDWKTNVPTHAGIEWGVSAGSYTSGLHAAFTGGTEHEAIPGGLTPTTTYHWRIRCTDANGQTLATTDDQVITTLGETGPDLVVTTSGRSPWLEAEHYQVCLTVVNLGSASARGVVLKKACLGKELAPESPTLPDELGDLPPNGIWTGAFLFGRASAGGPGDHVNLSVSGQWGGTGTVEGTFHRVIPLVLP